MRTALVVVLALLALFAFAFFAFAWGYSTGVDVPRYEVPTTYYVEYTQPITDLPA